MFRYPFIKTFMVLMAALFFTVQGFSQGHAATNGGLEHEHEGIACDVTLIVAEQAVISPVFVVPAPIIRSLSAKNIAKVTRPVRRFDSRAPPPRGPPL